MDPLPIDSLCAPLDANWGKTRNFVLHAPTGSGKSTRVPGMVLERLETGQQVWILQPRRMAARWLARRVAAERGTQVGDAVGYHIRHEARFGAATRILFLTEGMLLRRLQQDPLLSAVGAILFDEFHERHLQADVGLAIARRLQETRRPDLRLGVMSATLEAEALTAFLEPCTQLASDGRTFPVERVHLKASQLDPRAPVWGRATQAFALEAARGFEGDCLIFMPGAYEIQRTLDALSSHPAARGFDLHKLHGEQSPEDQDAVFAPGGRPKIIVSTNVAETSLTLPQVRLVIDSGLARIASYDPSRGLNTLVVEPISQASAEQRAGRAGRVAPGRCVRLWTEAEHSHRPAFLAPEIHRLELAETLLGLHATGTWHPDRFTWFDPPSAEHLEEAEALLRQLRAIDAEGALTPLGEELAQLPVHPRLGAMILAARRLDRLEDGVLLAAILEGRSLLERRADAATAQRRDALLAAAQEADSDHLSELHAWQNAAAQHFDPRWGREHGIQASAARTAGRTAQQLLRSLGAPTGRGQPLDAEALQTILLAGFADNVAHRLNPNNYTVETARGRRGEIARESLARAHDWIIGTEMTERSAGARVTTFLSQNSPLDPSLLKRTFPEDFHTRERVQLEGKQRRVTAVTEICFRELVIESREQSTPDLEQAAALLAAAVLAGELTLKNWNDRVEQWIARINFLARTCPDYGFSPFQQTDRQLIIEQLCYGSTAYSKIKDKAVQPFLDDWLPAGLAAEVDRLAPTGISLGERKRFRLRYPEDGPPVASGQLQKFYDVKHAELAVAERRVLPRIELLAPNQRPAQITDDLDAFWKGSYEEVKKQLRGRYPKHEWR